jgi:outer membrane biogenesis lipoprotein LolB
MEQDGWEIQFLRYHKVNGKQLPKKIYLQNNEFKVKLLIKYWNQGA